MILGMRGRPGMVINGKTYDFKSSDVIDIRGGRIYVNGAPYTDGPTQTFTKSGVPDSRRIRCGNLILRNGDVESWTLTGTLPVGTDAAEINWNDSNHDLELTLTGGNVDVEFTGTCVIEGTFDSITSQTVSGDFTFKGKAKKLCTSAVNGTTRVLDSRIGTLESRSVNGDTKIRNSTIKKDSGIQTVNGDVDLFLKHPAIVRPSIPSRARKAPKFSLRPSTAMFHLITARPFKNSKTHASPLCRS